MVKRRYTNAELAQGYLSVASQKATDGGAYREYLAISRMIGGIVGVNLQEFYEEHGRFPERIGVGKIIGGTLKSILDNGVDIARTKFIQRAEEKGWLKYTSGANSNVDIINPSYDSASRNYDNAGGD
jgi:hypothetical protein